MPVGNGSWRGSRDTQHHLAPGAAADGPPEMGALRCRALGTTSSEQPLWGIPFLPPPIAFLLPSLGPFKVLLIPHPVQVKSAPLSLLDQTKPALSPPP